MGHLQRIRELARPPAPGAVSSACAWGSGTNEDPSDWPLSGEPEQNAMCTQDSSEMCQPNINLECHCAVQALQVLRSLSQGLLGAMCNSRIETMQLHHRDKQLALIL